jgi:serine/threonine-protein kinase HipA
VSKYSSDSYRFAYGESYLNLPERISLFTPELPLGAGWIDAPVGLEMAGCLWDASPDSWGQRVIIARLTGLLGDAADRVNFDKITFLLESGSNRIGALDFQQSSTDYVSRSRTANLDELHAAAEALESGELREELARALVDGTAVGGARPKVLVVDDNIEYIAKLSTSTDPYPVVKAEAVAMELARQVGIHAPNSHVVKSLGRDVLLVERFDRPGAGQRRMMVSGLTMLGFGDFLGARYSSYPEMLDVLRQLSASGKDLGSTLFERVVFNIAIGNTDDHARNHAAFWDGHHLELTPAFDLCPQLRSGTETNQAMDIARSGARASKFSTCVAAAADYGLTDGEARDIIDSQVTIIEQAWAAAADLAQLTAVDRDTLWRRQILNQYAFAD